MRECLYKCGSDTPSTQEYHVYPLSASPLNLQLPKGIVCNKCNSYFSKLEQYFIERHPGASNRMTSLDKTRKGKQPKFSSGAGTATREQTADGHEFRYPLEKTEYKILENGDIVISGSYTPLPFNSVKIGRVLAKITLEFLYKFTDHNDLDPYAARMDPLREYAREGKCNINFWWFAWKRSSEPQKRPQVIKLQALGQEPVASFCLISFPGVSYLFPIPPVVPPASLQQNPHGWNVVDTQGEIEMPPETIDVTLLRMHSSEEDKNIKEK